MTSAESPDVIHHLRDGTPVRLRCAHLSAAKRGLVPADGAHDYAELALDRLLGRAG